MASIDPVTLVVTLFNFFIALTIFVMLLSRRMKTGIQALNILLWVFGSLFVLISTELVITFFSDHLPVYLNDSETIPVILEPIRILNYIFMFSIYIFCEQVLSAKVHRLRIAIIAIMTSAIITIGVIDINLSILVLTSDVLKFANDTRLDEFVFDIYQVLVMSFSVYVFNLQRTHSSAKALKRYSFYLELASLFFAISMAIEVFEHISDSFEIDAFISGIPTILVLAYVYIIHTRYIHLVPADIKFLQIIYKGGVPIYAADFGESAENIEYLVGPGLYSIKTVVGELIENNTEDFTITSISHSSGAIIFEKVDELIGVIQTSRDSHMLRSSMKFFLSKFLESYRDDLQNYKGVLQQRGITPDELLVKCVPIVESKQMISSLNRN